MAVSSKKSMRATAGEQSAPVNASEEWLANGPARVVAPQYTRL